MYALYTLQLHDYTYMYVVRINDSEYLQCNVVNKNKKKKRRIFYLYNNNIIIYLSDTEFVLVSTFDLFLMLKVTKQQNRT